MDFLPDEVWQALGVLFILFALACAGVGASLFWLISSLLG